MKAVTVRSFVRGTEFVTKVTDDHVSLSANGWGVEVRMSYEDARSMFLALTSAGVVTVTVDLSVSEVDAVHGSNHGPDDLVRLRLRHDPESARAGTIRLRGKRKEWKGMAAHVLFAINAATTRQVMGM